ncbi:exported hypothetical protein [Burkholderiales bacterium]|nr:exported hypothetical protein [Burkholderiales bacterium]
MQPAHPVNPALFWLLLVAIVALAVWLIRKNRQISDQRNEQFAVMVRHAGWRFEINPQTSSVVPGPQSPSVRDPQSDIEFTIDGGREMLAWRMWFDAGLRFQANSAGSQAARIPMAV